MTFALAIDLGGTKIEAALVDGDGHVVDGTRFRRPTGPRAAVDADAGAAALDEVLAECRTLPQWAAVAAVGIGSAGPVDLTAGTVSPINLPALADFPIVDRVRAATGLDDVSLRLDGTCIALAELWLGAARGVGNAIVLVVSTGVGGGVVSDGRVIAGATGNAGHIGQLVVDRVDGPIAASTVEGIASGPHTVAWARERGWQGEDGEALAAAVRAGDPTAILAVDRSAEAVGRGIVDAATLLDLELAVVGGGFSYVADDYTDRVQAAARAHAVNAYAGRIRVVRAALGGEAPLIGAAALVHRRDLLRG